ncbi:MULTISPECIES: hypothetical protein [unclassified Sphingobacterium]|uniref:hypothetical protein n=1 Tax=unclassified Sphingobacterium TaxID=2609468 RepID=UPI0025DA603B|nr:MULTISPECIES: hypothetical protein [unclassified Sphingobacterium]
MSNIFNSTRFLGLIRRQWIGFGRIYLMSIGIIAGVIFGFYAVNFASNYDGMKNQTAYSLLNFRTPLFCILGLFFVTVVSSSYFADLGKKTRAIFELMIPASQLEKFLVSLFYTVVVSIGSYLLVFYLIDLAFVAYLKGFGSMVLNQTASTGKAGSIDLWQYFYKVQYPHSAYYFYFAPILLNAIFLLGGIVFQNYQYVKTAISVVIYCVVWICFFVYLIKMQTQDTVGVMSNNYWSDSNHIFALIGAGALFLTLVLWCVAFLRLKEKEI